MNGKTAVLSFLLIFIVSTSAFRAVAEDYQLPSFAPPEGMAVDSCPLFIVLGFDDNRYPDGMEWTLDMLGEYTNPEGTGNSATYDGAPIRAVFYHTANALDNSEHGGERLLQTWRDALDAGHGVGNHTVTHHTGNETTYDEWRAEIDGCTEILVDKLDIDQSRIHGFRTPYLDFNEATFEAVADEGLLYECTMTQMQDYNEGKFLWPYTLDEGFPDKTIDGWKGEGVNPGLWEIPVYTVGENELMWPPITGFDSSILTQSSGSKFEQMLKNAVDYRLAEGGNRAPLTVGLHSDTYAEANPDGKNYDPALTLPERRDALKNFIEYALTHPEVRFVTAAQLIEWMRNPVALGRDNTSISQKTTPFSRAFDIASAGNQLTITAEKSMAVRIHLYTLKGEKIASREMSLTEGANRVRFDEYRGTAVLEIRSETGVFHQRVHLKE
ncbi:MAG: polysaccharide deacetylase family protein [Fibrobacterota bacterium]